MGGGQRGRGLQCGIDGPKPAKDHPFYKGDEEEGGKENLYHPRVEKL